MTHLTSISFEDSVFYCEGFQQAKRERGLSRLINDLLKAHFDVSKQVTPLELTGLEDELRKLAAREALLKDRKAQLEKEKQKEAERYRVVA